MTLPLLLVGTGVGGVMTWHHLQQGLRSHTEPSSTSLLHRDPAGTAPYRSFPVRTEDGNDATLVVRPEDAWRGAPDAAVTVVEFFDYECTYCKRVSAQLDRLLSSYEDRVLFVTRHFPIDPSCNPGVMNRRHPQACLAARAAECAREQGAFWAFHHLTFKNSHQLGADNLRQYAKKVGLDLRAFDACLASGRSLAAVRADGEDGRSLDIHGTPRIFINGRRYAGGHSAEQMARVLERELGATPAEAAREVRKLRARMSPAVEPIPEDVPPMRRVRHGDMEFLIDTFEASVVDGAVVSGPGLVPATRVSWYAAREACQAAGKRICTEREWVAACQGAEPVDDDGDGIHTNDMVEGNIWPYGDHHDPRRCWDGKDGETHRPVFTGEMPGCASQDGVYDLTGNMEEWVGATPEEAALMGGAYDTPNDYARCFSRNAVYGAGFANARTGFRCCMDPEQQEARAP